MLHLSSSQRYFLFSGDADMRKGFDSLSGLFTNQMKQTVTSGDIFIFLNRKRTHVKLLLWEGDGFAVYYKRLETGTYEVPKIHASNLAMHLSGQQLSLILQGVSLRHVRHRKRYQQQLQNGG